MYYLMWCLGDKFRQLEVAFFDIGRVSNKIPNVRTRIVAKTKKERLLPAHRRRQKPRRLGKKICCWDSLFFPGKLWIKNNMWKICFSLSLSLVVSCSCWFTVLEWWCPLANVLSRGGTRIAQYFLKAAATTTFESLENLLIKSCKKIIQSFF